MKILFVHNKYNYANKALGPDYIACDGFIKSIEKLNHELIKFECDDYTSNSDVRMFDRLIESADQHKPDLIFFVFCKEWFPNDKLEYLKKYNTIAWFGDDTWQFDKYTKNYAPHFSYCITTDKFSIPKYHNIGQNNVIYSQWAAIDSYNIPELNTNYKYDVTFVGSYHPVRHWFITELINRGINVETFGQGWHNGSLTGDQMVEVFAQSKINLNLSNSACCDIRYIWQEIKRDFTSTRKIYRQLEVLLNLKAKLNSLLNPAKNMPQIKARNFEIPFFGGFQITDYVPTIEDYYDIGKEIICYKDINEAELLINYYLNNDKEREEIKQRSYIKTINNHGYTHRFQEIFSYMQNIILSKRKAGV